MKLSTDCIWQGSITKTKSRRQIRCSKRWIIYAFDFIQSAEQVKESLWNYSTCFWYWSLNLQTRASGRADRWAMAEARRNWKLSECIERTSSHCRLLLPPSSCYVDGGILQGKLAPFITELSTGLIQESEKLGDRKAAESWRWASRSSNTCDNL